MLLQGAILRSGLGGSRGQDGARDKGIRNVKYRSSKICSHDSLPQVPEQLSEV